VPASLCRRAVCRSAARARIGSAGAHQAAAASRADSADAARTGRGRCRAARAGWRQRATHDRVRGEVGTRRRAQAAVALMATLVRALALDDQHLVDFLARSNAGVSWA